MDRTKTAELMPIAWRLGTGKSYLDYPRRQDLAAVAAMGASVVPLLEEWCEDDCSILKTGAKVALDHITKTTVKKPVAAAQPESTAVPLAALI